ncbi:hypothetical protein [Streptomyces sp. IBSBF 2435]|uniref:hypothetical protein n=1 Tax=Streptomyces sp. IBSBF 2435 TaxID=2903531 RepID=UPI002FDBFF0A
MRARRLIVVLAPAADIVDQDPGGEDVVLQLRVLVDTLTTWPWLRPALAAQRCRVLLLGVAGQPSQTTETT